MTRLTVIMAALLVGHAAAAAPRPAVVELFTSQGCSSCPPAEALLGELAGRPDVVALAFHVDYWDAIGWRDRFALPDATARQAAYQRSLGLAQLYTPQMVVDGRVDVVGSDRARVLALLAPRRDGVPVSLAAVGDAWVAELGAGAATQPAQIVLVAYLPAAATAIARGENAGRRLNEVNVVRAVRVLGTWDGRPRRIEVKRATLPADATAAAVLLQQPGGGPILGAATARLAAAH